MSESRDEGIQEESALPAKILIALIFANAVFDAAIGDWGTAVVLAVTAFGFADAVDGMREWQKLG